MPVKVPVKSCGGPPWRRYADRVTETPDAETPGGSLRDLFPAYYPPDESRLRDHFGRGLVVLDTNALFCAYRFNPQARDEFLGVLNLLGDRLWIPYQVGKEFHLSRRNVVADGIQAIERLTEAMAEKMDAVTDVVTDFAQRRGLNDAQAGELTGILASALDSLKSKASEFWPFDIDPDAPPSDDPIYLQLETLLEGRVGLPPEDPDGDHAEGMRRVAKGIPPGYMDARKKNGRASGDYMLWVQTIRKAKAAEVPVLLVTNDAKEDWVQTDSSGASWGPRNELILEMQREAGQPFHLLDVPEFLLHAPKFMPVTVSESTLEQARAGAADDAAGELRIRVYPAAALGDPEGGIVVVSDQAGNSVPLHDPGGRIERRLNEILRDNPGLVRSPIERALRGLSGLDLRGLQGIQGLDLQGIQGLRGLQGLNVQPDIFGIYSDGDSADGPGGAGSVDEPGPPL